MRPAERGPDRLHELGGTVIAAGVPRAAIRMSADVANEDRPDAPLATGSPRGVPQAARGRVRRRRVRLGRRAARGGHGAPRPSPGPSPGTARTPPWPIPTTSR